MENGCISLQYDRAFVAVNCNSDLKSVLRILIRIRIHRIHMFLGHLDPDPLVGSMDPDPDPALDPDPSLIKQI